MQNIILVCFDIVLLWIIVVIASLDNHYYVEDGIDIGKPMECNVVVNHHIELTEEEKAEARQKAIRQYQDEEIQKMKNRKKPKPATSNPNVSPTLFDF